jgi:hypothetical protein
MAKVTDMDVNALPPSAEQMRMALLEEQMAESDRQAKIQERQNQELTKFTNSFLKDQVNEEEIAMVRRLVVNAVKNGKYEALVYSFPSNLCTDSGRAINSGDPQWPETLQGKAKQFYERYLQNARPQGYKLKAMIINFPGGMPGDVGFFINWAPDTK